MWFGNSKSIREETFYRSEQTHRITWSVFCGESDVLL